jgi:hypothetical protein
MGRRRASSPNERSPQQVITATGCFDIEEIGVHGGDDTIKVGQVRGGGNRQNAAQRRTVS